MAMTTIAIQPGFEVTAQQAPRPARLHRMGAGLPPALRTVGALAALLLAVAVTGVVLVAFALVMPVLLVAALVMRRWQPRGERPGWRPASA